MYATSSQNETGMSTISCVFIEEGKVMSCGLIKGHGWRISNRNEDYVVAGAVESFQSKNH
jgi:hypothetical protein